MNKKRLSVVMAGAMLASSVAPVLAETTKSETSAAELGLLIQKVREKLNSAKFANETKADRDRNGGEAGKAVYFIKVNGVEYKDTQIDTQGELQTVLGNLKVGSGVEICSKGHVVENEKYYATTEQKTKYTVASLTSLATALKDTSKGIGQKLANVVSDATITGNVLTVTFKSGVTIPALKIAEGDYVLDTNKYLNENNVAITLPSSVNPADFKGFPESDATAFVDLASESVETITITPGGNDLAIEDLYDGLMLTTKGHDFFSMLKEADAMGRGYYVNGNAGVINGTSVSNREANKGLVANAIQKDTKGNYVFTVTLPSFKLDNTADGDSTDAKVLPEVKYTITSKDEKNAERLATWMLKPLARVDILAGSNRYETAVKIAEEYAGLTTVGTQAQVTAKNANIVLVNGNALVDGLAAAPLAATKTNTVSNTNGVGTKQVSAPILLTEADALPKATKAYLKELLSNVEIGSLKKVTIHLVGGETVLNKSLERELRGLGFDVKRYGGDNREETSLEVAEAIESGKTNRERFVVGAEGEADAMSIASVAAFNKTPIIVAKKGGISEDALYTFDENANVAIVGGESVVSAAEEKELKSAAKSVTRLAGSNRKGTNAKIIETYYKGNFVGTVANTAGNTDHVIVAKDGQRDKTELVDALAAANFASEIKAPIVLATDKLSKDQINALELNTKKSTALYQIGIGVAKDVVKTLAEGLDLTNNNRY